MPKGRKKKKGVETPSPPRKPSPPLTPECDQFGGTEMADPNNRSLYEYATPMLDGLQHSIRRPAVQANNFEIKPATIQLLQAYGQFGGSPVEDPNNHILNFLEICDTFKQNGVSDDAIRLRLFPFSLRDKAKAWLQSLPQGSITTWEELAQQFLAKYFPPGKTAKMRNDITSFVQFDSENLYEAWERFKELLRRCPHHGLPKWLQVQTFYNGLSSVMRTTIDAAAGGALMAKPVDDAYELLETMSSNNYQWHSDRLVPAKAAGMQGMEVISTLSAQISALTKEVKALGIQSSAKSISPFVESCESCGGGHSSDQCPDNMESVQFLANRSLNNPYSNTYNPGWRNHPNFGWNQNQGAGSSSAARPNNPPGFHAGGFNQQSRASPPLTEKKPSLEDMMMAYMSKTDSLIQNQNALIQSQASSLRNLETQVGQLAHALNSRPQGTLPSDTELNPRREGKEHCMAITLRSGNKIEENPNTAEYEKSKEAESAVTEKPVEKPPGESSEKLITRPRPPPPFPQKLLKQKSDQQFKKFLDIFKKLHINIPFAEALEQMPSYVKFMKDILSKKRRLSDFETVALTEECSAILQNKLPPKLKDPGSFNIPCTIGDKFCGKALCDLGASINLMPLSVFKKLGLGEATPTTVMLQLADRSIAYPRGVIEDVLVKVDKFIFPADFIVLDYEEDREIPIILGRPFLATGRTIIDVQKGELKMRVQNESVTFNVFKAMKLPNEPEECFKVNVIESSPPSSSTLPEAGPASSSDDLRFSFDQFLCFQETQAQWMQDQHQLLEDQRQLSEAQHQMVMAELQALRARSNYHTSCIGVVHANVRQLIAYIEGRNPQPPYQDLPPPPEP